MCDNTLRTRVRMAAPSFSFLPTPHKMQPAAQPASSSNRQRASKRYLVSPYVDHGHITPLSEPSSNNGEFLPQKNKRKNEKNLPYRA